ncbi:MAG: hypothetical protein JWN71_4879 [Xanthobacteraceae bacterium]|jgi:hypothetical protein|nr:hypothetical protein [Xanthobacteraceae bacterium]
MRAVLILTVLLAGLTSAHATGGVSCQAQDGSLKFEAGGALGRSVGGSLMNFTGELKVSLKAVPDDFRELKLLDADVSQRWIDDKEVRLHLHRERTQGRFGYVDLVILTKRVDERRYAGRYVLSISNIESDAATEAKAVKARGKVTCDTE